MISGRFSHTKMFAVMLFFSFLFFIGLFIYAPAFSGGDIIIPGLSSLQPFTRETNYLSIEGYVSTYVRINYGKNISHAEAKKIIKNSQKQKQASISNSESIRETKFRISRNNVLLKNILANYKNSSNKNKKNEIKIKNEPPSLIYESKAKTTKTGFKTQGGTALLIPFKNLTNKTESWDHVSYYIKKYFQNKNINVIQMEPAAEGCFKKQPTAILDAARKFNANYIISGEIERYERYKKISATGAVIDVAFFGVNNHADIILRSSVFDISKNSFVLDSSVRHTKKRQVFGIFNASRSTMSYTVKEAIDRLYSGI